MIKPSLLGALIGLIGLLMAASPAHAVIPQGDLHSDQYNPHPVIRVAPVYLHTGLGRAGRAIRYLAIR